MANASHVSSFNPDLALCVGEASGDWIAALAIEQLLSASRKNDFMLQVEGIAGPKLRALGVTALFQSEALSVRGYVEVLRHLPRLLKIRKELAIRWSRVARPKVFLGVDAPDFNLDLELKLRRAGVATVQLVCPSVWAWRKERLHKIKQACEQVLCIFPFEPALLESWDIRATYIGHPMASVVPKKYDPLTYRTLLGLPHDVDLLAVLPGSRHAEVKHLGPVFTQACLELKKHKPHLRFVTPLPAGPLVPLFESMIPELLKDQWMLVAGQSHECLATANAVLLASGTASLEAMMYGKPMVIAYKMPWLSYQMMKGKAYTPYIGLPNILLQDFAVPELIQDEATPLALCEKVLFQLDDEANRQNLERIFAEQHDLLCRPSGQRVAQVLQEYVF